MNRNRYYSTKQRNISAKGRTKEEAEKMIKDFLAAGVIVKRAKK